MLWLLETICIIFVIILLCTLFTDVKCYYIPADKRKDCYGDQNTCEQKDNCCWDPLSKAFDGPWCYHPPGMEILLKYLAQKIPDYFA